MSEGRIITEPLEPGSIVVLGCPMCPWQSAQTVVEDHPNGTWNAMNMRQYEYRRHFDVNHRPLALKLVLDS